MGRWPNARSAAAWMLLGVLVLILLWPGRAGAIARADLSVCREARIEDFGAAGTRVLPISCGREFSVSLPYIVLFWEVSQIDYPATFRWELIDPSQTTVAQYNGRLDPPSPGSWTFTNFDVLPLAATAKDIGDRNPRLRARIIPLGGSPARERLGEWKVRFTLSGAPITLSFTLKP